MTTEEGAGRLGDNATGLAVWQQTALDAPDGTTLTITALPARHGPAGGDRGPVIGFALTASGEVVYLSGDTVWFAGVQEVAQRFDVSVALLNLGAALLRAVGDEPLTFTAAEAVLVARAMPRARIIPLHYEGWEHFRESRADIQLAFESVGLEERLLWAPPGEAVDPID